MENKYNFYLKQLNFEKNPAGGHYCLVNSSDDIKVKLNDHDCQNQKERTIQNTVYSLYKKNDIFPFHYLQTQQEHLIHVDGGALTFYIIESEDKVKEVKLGKDIANGENISLSMKPQQIFAIQCESDYALITAICTPAWEFDDSIMCDRNQLMQKYPKHQKIIDQIYKQ